METGGKTGAAGGNLRSLTTAVACAIAFFSVALICTIAYAGWYANRSAIENDRLLVFNGFSQSIARTLNEQKGFAWWDDAVRNIDIGFDPNWIDSNIGSSLVNTYGYEEVYIIGAGGDFRYAYYGVGRQGTPDVQSRAVIVAPLLKKLHEGRSDELTERPDYFRRLQRTRAIPRHPDEKPDWVGHILSVDGRAAIATILTIQPHAEQSLTVPTPSHLFSLVFLDDMYFSRIGRTLLLPDLALHTSSADIRQPVSTPLITDEGQMAGTLSWTARRPGDVLLKLVLPLAIVGLLGAALIVLIMLRQLYKASATLTAREAEALHRSRHDPLSDLPNRYYFAEQLDAALASADGRSGHDLVMAYIDIDRFKEINDTLGYQAGDKLIGAVSARLSAHLEEGELAARFAEDEFAVFSPIRREAEAMQLAMRLAEALRPRFHIGGRDVQITASIGLACAPSHGTSSDTLIRNAATALYAAQAIGHDQIMLFSREIAQELQNRRDIEAELEAAIKTGQLDLHYQPIIACATGEMTGAEALLRWTHPVRGPIPPSIFIPIAEEAGLMPMLGAWVLERAFADHARLPGLEIAINLSPAQLRGTGIRNQLAELTRRHGVLPHRIIFEITETVLMNSSATTKETMDFIRAMGFQLALDDFGTGYSSLRYLCDFTFDQLKIDRSFVSEIDQTGNALAIVQSAVQLGRNLGMQVVAEGVETEAEASAMRFLGCTAMQGFHFARPMPFDALKASLTDRKRQPAHTMVR